MWFWPTAMDRRIPWRRYETNRHLECPNYYSTALFAQSGIISTNRSADWTHAGINGYSTSGNLPSASWTQCGAPIAPYSGTGALILNAMNHTGSGYTGCGANTYVQLAAGTFTLSTGILHVVGVSGTELRGMGADQTHLVFTGNSTCQGGNGSCMIGFDSSDNTDPTSPGPSTIVNWTGGYSKGSTVLNVSNLSNIIANVTEAVMDQCDTGYSGATCAGTAVDNWPALRLHGDKYATTPTGCSVNGPDTGLARPHRFELEAAMVTACSPACGTNSAGTITIDTPLLNPDWGSRTPQVWFFTPLQYVGIQNLSVDDSAVAISEYRRSQFEEFAHICWAHGESPSFMPITLASTWFKRSIPTSRQTMFSMRASISLTLTPLASSTTGRATSLPTTSCRLYDRRSCAKGLVLGTSSSQTTQSTTTPETTSFSAASGTATLTARIMT